MARSGSNHRTYVRGGGDLIFVTVGSQRPFERLIRAVDHWAGLQGRSDVFAQIANSNYRPDNVCFTRFIGALEFRRWLERATVVVAHAGMGSIISALEFGKAIVVMPRRARFHEAHDDHQVATAHWFGEQGRVVVVDDEQDLARELGHPAILSSAPQISASASPQLLATIREFVALHHG